MGTLKKHSIFYEGGTGKPWVKGNGDPKGGILFENVIDSMGYIIYPRWLLLNKDVSPSAKLLALYFYNYDWEIDNGYRDKPQKREQIAKDLNMSIEEIDVYIQELEGVDIVEEREDDEEE